MNNEFQQKNIDNIKRFYQKIEKSDEFIRKLYEYKKIGKLTSNQIKEFETEIEKIIQYLEKIYKENKIISSNVDLSNKYMDLIMLWNYYKNGMEIKSKDEEAVEVRNLLNNIMGEYNQEHYGKK